jgi:hypothetical protein
VHIHVKFVIFIYNPEFFFPKYVLVRTERIFTGCFAFWNVPFSGAGQLRFAFLE